MAVLTIYGDSLSGNCHKARYVANLRGIPHQWRETSVLKHETRTPAFLKLNPVGQVPVVILPDGRMLAQSNAIMLHLAEGSDLIPRDAYARAQMFQWLFWEQYSHETAIAVLRFHQFLLRKAASEIDPTLKPKSERALTIMNDHLTTRSYFVGDVLTLADIALVAYTRMAGDVDLDLARWPHVQAWVGRVVERLDSVKDSSVRG